MCHVARANPHWRDFEGGGTTLTCFVGPHTYISPAWYHEPIAVPTWSYTAVHIRGKVRLVHDTDLLRAHVTRPRRFGARQPRGLTAEPGSPLAPILPPYGRVPGHQLAVVRGDR